MKMDTTQYLGRIEKWKCEFCGSRHKKLASIVNGDNKTIGNTIICCKCGHTENFVLSDEAIPVYAAGLKEDRVVQIDIKCGSSGDDVIRFCDDNSECPYNVYGEKKPDPPRTSKERDLFNKIKPVLEMYEGRNFDKQEPEQEPETPEKENQKGKEHYRIL